MLRDDRFFSEPSTAAAPRHSKEALRGIGDPALREAQDFLWSMGGGPRAAAGPLVGDEVEFALPDGLRRTGRVHEIQRQDAIVQVGVGEFNIVPVARLEPLRAPTRRSAKKANIREALSQGSLPGPGSSAPVLHETREPIPLGATGDYALTLSYSAGRAPSSSEVEAYVQAKYPGARILDGDDSHPGRIALVAQMVSPGHAPAPDAAPAGAPGPAGHEADLELDAAPNMRDVDFRREQERYQQEQARQKSEEEKSKLRRLRQRQQQQAPVADPPPPQWPPRGADVDLEATAEGLNYLAALNPHVDLVETSIERTATSTVCHFRVERDGTPCFLRAGRLTRTLAEGLEPAVGTVRYGSETGTTLFAPGLRTAAPYDSGTGPLSMHEDAPTEDGSYVVKADGPASEQDGEARETIGGPGLHVAVDDTARAYYDDYYPDGYGAQLTRDVLQPSRSPVLPPQPPPRPRGEPGRSRGAPPPRGARTAQEDDGDAQSKGRGGKDESFDDVYGPPPSESYAGRRPPAKAELRFRLTDLSRKGDYMVMAIVWDADATTDMAPADIVHNVKSFVKQRASEKEFIDLGFIGRPVIESCDTKAGLATVRVRSSEARVAPPEFIQGEATYNEPVR